MQSRREWVEIGVGVVLVVVVVLGFSHASRARRVLQCSSVVVESRDRKATNFLTRERLLDMLRGKMGDPVGHPLLAINTRAVEEMVLSLSPIARCDAYVDMDGCLRVRVWQREAIARIMPQRGDSWYVATDGHVFTALPGYVAPVLVVSGAVCSVPEGPGGERLIEGSGDFYGMLFGLLKRVYDDSFWRAQVVQVYVRDTLNVELVPRVGSQIVSLGGLDGYEYKLAKLRSLYAAKLPGAGLNRYDRIDLRYGDQVVCRRK